jgi:hypothetical protein
LKYNPKALFDGVIMNPPYIRQEKIDDLLPFGITKKTIRENLIYSGLPSTANMYMYFVIKAISLLKSGGELVVIFPSSWMSARSGKSFEKLIKEQTRIVEKIYVSGDVFNENALVDVVILKLIKESSKSEDIEEKHLILVDGKLQEKVFDIKVQDISLPVSFSEYASVRRGLSTGWNKMFINPEGVVDKEVLVDIISSPKCVNGYSTSGASFDKLLMIPTEKELSVELTQYIDKRRSELLSSKKPKTLFEKCKEGDSWFNLKDLNCKGIIFGYIIRNDMRFILNDAKVIARDNFYIIKPKANEYLMLSLMNNYYTYYQLEIMGKKYGAGLLKIQRYDMENLKFIDVECLTDDEKNGLETLGKKLAKTGDGNLIEEITKLISKHTNISYEDVKDVFYDAKNRRLEA